MTSSKKADEVNIRSYHYQYHIWQSNQRRQRIDNPSLTGTEEDHSGHKSRGDLSIHRNIEYLVVHLAEPEKHEGCVRTIMRMVPNWAGLIRDTEIIKERVSWNYWTLVDSLRTIIPLRPFLKDAVPMLYNRCWMFDSWGLKNIQC